MKFQKYYLACQLAGVNFDNVRNIAAHWLYGTSPWTLAHLSRMGIVYNPPGH